MILWYPAKGGIRNFFFNFFSELDHSPVTGCCYGDFDHIVNGDWEKPSFSVP